MPRVMLTEVQAVEGAQLKTAAPSLAVPRIGAYLFRQTSPRVDTCFSALSYDVIEVTLAGWQRYQASLSGSRARPAQFVAGDATLYPNGAEVHLRGKCDADVVLMVLHPAILADSVSAENGNSMFAEPLKPLRSRALVRLALRALRVDAAEPHFADDVEGLEQELCATLVQGCRFPGSAKGIHARLSPWTLQKVLHYMRDNLDGDCSLATLSSLAGLSKFHFLRCFATATGQSPHRLLLEMRLAEARQLLSRSTTDLSALSVRLGFASQSHFAGAFRKCMGISPGKYRGLMRGTYCSSHKLS